VTLFTSSNLVTVTAYGVASIDGQGKPTLGAPVTLRALWLAYAGGGGTQSGAENFVTMPDGTRQIVHATAYVRPEDAESVPPVGGTVAYEAQAYTILERKLVRRINRQVSHVRLRLQVAGTPLPGA
jgi:hypothetical protein